MKPTNSQIESIAEDLECGMICNFNFKTGEIVVTRDFENNPYAEESQWQDELNKIRKNPDDFFEFTGLESRDKLRIMKNFTEEVDDKNLQKELFKALNQRKPFQEFKWIISDAGKYKQQWRDFKKESLIEWVKEQMEYAEDKFE